MKQMEPLVYLHEKEGYRHGAIREIVSGAICTAVELSDGTLGTVANLGVSVPTDKQNYKNLDLSDSAHRIVYTAYLNALLTGNSDFEEADIMEKLNFNSTEHIVMVGYFRPVVKKFDKLGIPLHIFDLRAQDERLLPMENISDYVRRADRLIITSTTLVHNTLMPILQFKNPLCETYMLGPSSIVHTDLKTLYGMNHIFGVKFAKSDERVKQAIVNGGGTKTFLKFASKIYL